MSDDSKPGIGIKSVVKTLRLLKLFSPQYPVRSAEDMASSLGYPKSSVQRILATAEREGFLSKVAPRRNGFLFLIHLSVQDRGNNKQQRLCIHSLSRKEESK
jgi:DNA-binding MarR family transcriptional regulator